MNDRDLTANYAELEKQYSLNRKEGYKYRGYRTKRVILEYYDAMGEAIYTDRPYQTILDPSPTDPCISRQTKKARSCLYSETIIHHRKYINSYMGSK